MRLIEIIKEEIDKYFNDNKKLETNLDLPNSLGYSPGRVVTRAVDSNNLTPTYPGDDQIQQMIDDNGITAISMNEEEVNFDSPLILFKGRGRSGETLDKREPKFGPGLYFTSKEEIARKYSDQVYKYQIEPKKAFKTPQFKFISKYQIWSLRIIEEFGSKNEWVNDLKSKGYDMVIGYNSAFKEWEYVVLDKSIITKEEKVESAEQEAQPMEESKKKEITTLNFFDFDGTLADAMEPGKGKKEYKKITGKTYPSMNWWGSSKSLEPFDVKLFPKVKAEYEKKKGAPQSKTYLLTNRIEKLSPQVKSILDDGGVTMDGYDFYKSGKSKSDRIKDILKEFPKVKTINVYDDRADQLKVFKELKKELDHYYITVNVFRCTKGKIKETK